ncbi:pentatricopeptide repeat-containing protein At1g64100-like [Papaver somniferum]|nr:pentatricopeptide repeat-containing protein At1g64100-like [Papaver somniferum]
MKLGPNKSVITRVISSYSYHHLHNHSGAYYNNGVTKLERFVRDECNAGRIKKLDDGLRYFDQLILESPLPSNVTFCHLLGSLSKIKCYSDVIMLFCLLGEIIKRGYHPNVITFGTLIKGLCQQGKIDSAFQVFGKMRYTSQRMFSYEALVLFSEMLRDSDVVPVVVYNSLINGLCSSGRFKEAERFFQEMADRGISANVKTYSCMIDGHCLRGHWEEARRYFDEMMDRGISPDIVTFNILIDSHCKDGMTKDAWACLN